MAQQTSQSQPTGKTGVSGSNATINSGGMTSSGMRDSTTGMNAGSGPERQSQRLACDRADGDNRPEWPAIEQ